MTTSELLEKALPRCWYFTQDGEHSIWIRTETCNEGNIPICHLGANHPMDIQKAHAELIVRAVNSFEALRSVAQKLVSMESQPSNNESMVLLSAAIEALSLADGKELKMVSGSDAP